MQPKTIVEGYTVDGARFRGTIYPNYERLTFYMVWKNGQFMGVFGSISVRYVITSQINVSY